jgi:predicted phage terminase large subunit-like protein
LTFIPASVYDNKILLKKDPDYLANLMSLTLIDMERLLKGNWKIRPEAGKVFDRAWFEIVDIAPVGGTVCRFWDFAATKKEMKGRDPDYSAGVKIRLLRGAYYIEDCIAVQEGPAEVDRMFKNMAIQDKKEAKSTGAKYRLRWETEPGASGKRENYRLTTMMAGFDAAGVPPQGDKLSRAKPLAAQSRVGNVYLVRGKWNEEWLKHMHHQPDWPHDDIMDGSSGAFNDLTGGKKTVGVIGRGR